MDLTSEGLNSLVNVPTKTFLGYAVSLGNADIVRYLLSKGANPNGKTKEGYPLSVPITVIPTRDVEIFKEMLNLLLRAGANINFYGMNGRSVLASLFLQSRVASKYSFEKLYTMVAYTLSKGSNPNIRFAEFNPLNRTLNYIKFRFSSHRRKMVYLLLAYGANPKLRFIDGTTLSVPDSDDYVYQPIFDLILDDNHRDVHLLTRVARALKIPVQNYSHKKNRAELFKCIYYLLEHKDEIDFDSIAKYRGRKLKRTCNPTLTIMGDDFNEFTENEIITFKEGHTYWCFHVSEVPNLLETQTNPYSGKSFPDSFLDQLLKSKYVEEITMQEALETFNQPPLDDHRDVVFLQLDDLDTFLKPFDPEFSASTLYTIPNSALLDILFRFNSYRYIPDMMQIRNNSGLNSKEYRQKLIKYIANYSLKMLEESAITPILLATELNHIFIAYDIIKGWEKLLGRKELLDWIPDIGNRSFNVFEDILGIEKYQAMLALLVGELKQPVLINERWEEVRTALRNYREDIRQGIN